MGKSVNSTVANRSVIVKSIKYENCNFEDYLPDPLLQPWFYRGRKHLSLQKASHQSNFRSALRSQRLRNEIQGAFEQVRSRDQFAPRSTRSGRRFTRIILE